MKNSELEVGRIYYGKATKRPVKIEELVGDAVLYCPVAEDHSTDGVSKLCSKDNFRRRYKIVA